MKVEPELIAVYALCSLLLLGGIVCGVYICLDPVSAFGTSR